MGSRFTTTPDAVVATGVLIRLFGDVRFAVELQRAPDSGGAPGVWATLLTLDPGVVDHFDELPKDGATYWYRARHVASDRDPGAYTNAVSTRSAELPTSLDASSASVSLQLATPVAASLGGTGQSSYAVGDLLYASAQYALSRLAVGAAGAFLKVSGGVPVWAALATGDIASGVLGVSRGGTGVADPTSGNLLVGAGASAMTLLAPGVAGGYVRSDGVAWVRSTIQAGDLPAHTHAWADVSKAGSSLLDLATRSAGDLSSGNLAYARLPTGGGTWDTGGGSVTLLAPFLRVQAATSPELDFFGSANALDEKQWDIVQGATTLTFRAVNDANTVGNTWLDVTRSGATITGVRVFAGGVQALGVNSSGQVSTFNGAAGVVGWSAVGKVGSSLADLATRSAGDLASGNLAYARLPTGAGTWSVGGALTISPLLVVGWDESGPALKIKRFQDAVDPGQAFILLRNAADTADRFSVAWSGLVTSAQGFSGDGSSLTGLNAGNVASGLLAVARGGTGAALALAAEDVVLGASATAMKRLAVGANGKVLGVSGGLVAWVDPPASSNAVVTNPSVAQTILGQNLVLKGSPNPTFVARDKDSPKLLLHGLWENGTDPVSDLRDHRFGMRSDPQSATTAKWVLDYEGVDQWAIDQTGTLVGGIVPWARVDKVGSSLADLATRSAADLATGTLADARLSTNVPLKNAAAIITETYRFDKQVHPNPEEKGNLGATPTFDFNLGVVKHGTANLAITSITLSNPVKGATYYVEFISDAIARSIAGWPATVKGNKLATTAGVAGKKHLQVLYYDGTDYIATVAADGV